ncbi:pimeloyl-ACP methyl ester carboxylesterase [Pseudomonas sp. 2957]|jgi:pimeloyl-ACP methyl ester carboxylesterase|uniref:alpha/beta fold hydrolase n=1 Tax=Pseudomonas TaxID=286 RepID=UPI00070142FA|nr:MULTISPECIES: alpha/beta hydrolase [Pseudomonas]KQT63053.1 alpha/beta hydrolase [Pseudomonas sp. Leaf434]MDR6948100.1 pimeloyl-ACP methyl ester carboxylesterase [Pseudomonas sp. 2957]UST78730.1 alpha/beta fold hydrolase [Pseudomonas siliginis]WLG61341.1 alpha/beta hydrolase [Pseudomonas sp. FP1762]
MFKRVFSVAAALAALLFGAGSFAAGRCDVNVPTEHAELAQVSLAYQSIGRASDPALLLVMGLGGQLIHWPDEVVVALCQQGFRVIRYDNRDVGLSTWRQAPIEANLTFEVLRYKLGLPVSAPYSLTDMADDALGLMTALKVEQFHVLGASMGGMIAQHMAAMAPQRVESLTLIMTTSGAEGLPAPSAALVQLLSRRGAPNREVALEQQADLLAALGSPAVTDDRQALLQQAAASYDRAFNPEGVKRQIMAILAEPSRVALLNQLRVPTLVVHGTADPLLPVMHGVHLAAHIQGSQLKLIPGLAHRFQEAFKEPLLAAVLPYLQAHREDTSHWARVDPPAPNNLL